MLSSKLVRRYLELRSTTPTIREGIQERMKSLIRLQRISQDFSYCISLHLGRLQILDKEGNEAQSCKEALRKRRRNSSQKCTSCRFR